MAWPPKPPSLTRSAIIVVRDNEICYSYGKSLLNRK